MEKERSFRLGIIGPCITFQQFLPVSALYHRKLYWALRKQDGINLKVSIDKDTLDDPQDRLLRLLDRETLDGVLVHVLGIEPKASLIFPGDKERKTRLHPFLWNRNRKKNAGDIYPWHQLPTPVAVSLKDESWHDKKLPLSRCCGISLRQVNLMMSGLVGLHRWAIEDELENIEQVRGICERRGIGLFILGSLPRNTAPGELAIWRKLNRAMECDLKEKNIAHWLVDRTEDEDGNPILRGNGLFPSRAGHAYIGLKLYETMGPWVKGLVEKSHGN